MTFKCVNCGLRLSHMRRRLLTEISSEDYLCHTCWELRNSQDAEQPVFGHQKICVSCGRSILRIRSRRVVRKEMDTREMHARNVISEQIHPRQLQATDEICRPCWQKVLRIVNPQQQVDNDMKQNEMKTEVKEEVEEIFLEEMEDIFLEEVEETNQDRSLSKPSTSSVPMAIPLKTENVLPTSSNIKDKIIFPTTRRAAATGTRCLFIECKNPEKLSVPDSIRRTVLADFNFYIPISMRICRYHLGSNLFEDLYAAQNTLSTFSATYIEYMVLLLRTTSSIDFSQPEIINDHLFIYWFGRTKDEYKEILRRVPRLNSNKIKLGLSALLLKMRTGNSNERISALFTIARKTLESYMNKCRIILQIIYNNLWKHIVILTFSEVAQAYASKRLCTKVYPGSKSTLSSSKATFPRMFSMSTLIDVKCRDCKQPKTHYLYLKNNKNTNN